MTITKTPFVQRQFTKRIEAVTHIRPIFMPKDEFESLLNRKLLDTAESDILSDADGLTLIRGLGRAGALELLFKIGLVFSELDIPSTR